jgi:hypothetical protein
VTRGRRFWITRTTGAAAVIAGVTAVLVATPAAALPGLILVSSATVGPTPGGLYYAEALCPVGTQLTGGGARAGDGSVHLVAATASVDGDPRWRAGGLGNGGASTSMTAYAICAAGMNGYRTVRAEHLPPAGSSTAAATATCPGGTRVIGAGGSNAGQPGYVLDGIWIAPDLTSVYVRTLRGPGASPDTAPYAVATAICVDPVPGQQRVTAATRNSTGTVKSISVSCPGGTRLHGLGGMIGGGGGQVGLQSLTATRTFTRTLTGASVTARVLAGANPPGSWRAEVYGVCAR